MDRAWLELVGAATRRPFGVATVFPTSRALAGQLAAAVRAAPPGPVVELGAGGGAITRELLPVARGTLTALEVDSVLARFLATRYPAASVRRAAAEELGRYVAPGSVSAVVASLPWTLLAPLARERILAAVHNALVPGGVFATYLCLNAVVHPQGRSFLARVRAHFAVVDPERVEWRNVPPARVILGWRGS